MRLVVDTASDTVIDLGRRRLLVLGLVTTLLLATGPAWVELVRVIRRPDDVDPASALRPAPAVRRQRGSSTTTGISRSVHFWYFAKSA